jgi:hypothetical protein
MWKCELQPGNLRIATFSSDVLNLDSQLSGPKNLLGRVYLWAGHGFSVPIRQNS